MTAQGAVQREGEGRVTAELLTRGFARLLTAGELGLGGSGA